LLLRECAWLLLGGFCWWRLCPAALGRIRRWIGFAICAVVFLLPVAWMEGRWLHWWWLQPCIGEPLDAVVSRLGAARRAENGQWVIAYAAPYYWIIPQFGMIRISIDSARRVESWDVTWR